MRTRAEEEGVEAAAVAIGAAAGGPGTLHLADTHGTLRNRRIHGRAAELRLEQASRGEADIAHRFRVETQAVLACEVAVVGILEREIRPGLGAAQVDFARDDEL